MEQLTFEENPYINITEYTQIAMLTMEVAILKVLEAKGLKAEMAAGLSLGEYGALAAAGVMELWAEMGEMLLPILVAIIPVTVLVMVSAGKTTQALTGRKKKEADNDAAAE